MHSCIKSFEKVFCQRFCRSIDQPLPELGDLAADRSLDRITQGMAATRGRELHLGAALAMASGAALPLKADGVALRRVDLRKGNFSGELGRYGADLERHADGVSVRAGGLHLVATGYALLEHFGVVERIPGLLLGDCQFAAALHFHRMSS